MPRRGCGGGVVAALLLVAACAANAPRAAAPPAPMPTLELELTIESPARAGKPLVGEATLVNRGPSAVTVVVPGDGSTDGWRSPIVRWTPFPPLQRDCANVDALRAAEIVELQPGQRCALDWLGDVTPTVGEHMVTVELEHVPDLTWQGLGGHDPALLAHLRRIPAFRVTSAPVLVRVLP